NGTTTRSFDGSFTIPSGATSITVAVTLPRVADPRFGNTTRTFTIPLGQAGPKRRITRSSGADGTGQVNPPPPQDPGLAPGKSRSSNGDSSCPGAVYLFAGEEHREEVDLVVPGRGAANFVMGRTFRSRNTFDGPIGQRWDFTLN